MRTDRRMERLIGYQRILWHFGIKQMTFATPTGWNFYHWKRFMNPIICFHDQNIHLFDQWTHVGGLTTVPKSKDHWYWMTSGNKVNYSLKFGSGQPDNAGGNEMCLSIGKQPGNFFFNDVNCYGMHQFKFICQTLQF